MSKPASRKWLRELFLHATDQSLTVLLVSLVLLLFVVYPFFHLEGFGRYLTDILFSFILLSTVFAVLGQRLRRIALCLAVTTLFIRWATYAGPTRELVLANTLLAIVFLVFANGVILERIFARGRITHARIQGAVAVYLLIGLTFGLAYALIETLQPGSFEIGELVAGSTDARGSHDRLMGRFSYYSFITLTTVGYGDVIPVHAVAKQTAVLEGLIGQLYPAILLARLVSMELAQSMSRNKDG